MQDEPIVDAYVGVDLLTLLSLPIKPISSAGQIGEMLPM